MDFSVTDQKLIEDNPLEPSILGGVRASLQKADGERDRSQPLTAAFALSQEGSRTALSRFVLGLQGHPVAEQLRPFGFGRPVNSQLASVFARLTSDELELTFFIPLVSLIIDDADDIEIWKAVLNLLNHTRHTPPLGIPPLLPDTPVTPSFASQQGSEQTRELVEPRLFEEIKQCTYRDVKGFYAKYFENKAWEEKAKRTYEVCKARYANGRWIGFPDPPEQNMVLKWLFSLQDEFFPDERGCYYTTHNRALHGSDAKRQLDLLVRKSLPQGIEEPHDWKDTRVIGELKAGDEQSQSKKLLLQLAAYAREVFAKQPTRPYSSANFDIHVEPERFIQALVGYVMMSDKELGLDQTTEERNGEVHLSIEDAESGEKRLLMLRPTPIASQAAIVCRGTSCYLARNAEAEIPQYVVKFSWRSSKRVPEGDLLRLARDKGVEGVARLVAFKDNITSIKKLRGWLDFGERYSFREFIARSSSVNSQSSSRAVLTRSIGQGHGLGITDGSSSRKRKLRSDEVESSKRSRSNSQTSTPANSGQELESDVRQGMCAIENTELTSLIETSEESYDNRILCCLVISPPGEPISSFDSIGGLLETLRDAVKGHLSLYEAGILHRDISSRNIIRTGGLLKGMLIDLDLAKLIGKERSGARHRTGTMEFMAIEVLDGIAHTYRHDLESFFYVFLWICITHGWSFIGRPQDRPMPSGLQRWYSGNYATIALAKVGHMFKKRFETLLNEFPPGFEQAKTAARKIRTILFPIRDGDIFTGTLKEHKDLYGPIIEAFTTASEACAKSE